MDPVDRASSRSHIVASVNGPDRHPRDIAVAVNGTIQAVGNTFKLAVGNAGELVSVMVPESAFHKGKNTRAGPASAARGGRLQIRQADLDVVQEVVVLLARLRRHEQERRADLLGALAAAAELLRDRLVGG